MPTALVAITTQHVLDYQHDAKVLPVNTARSSEFVEQLETLLAFRQARRRERWHKRGVERAHLEVLMALAENGSSSMRVLAATVGSSPAALTGVVDRMQTRGLILRTTDPTDRRSIRVSLAPEGENALAEIDLVRRNSVVALVDAMTDQELEAVAVGLTALATASERASSPASDNTGVFGSRGFWRLALQAVEAAKRDRRHHRVSS